MGLGFCLLFISNNAKIVIAQSLPSKPVALYIRDGSMQASVYGVDLDVVVVVVVVVVF